MRLRSPDFEHESLIPSRFTCDGENINPTLLISEVPEEAKSLALIVDDPDALSGTWTHWTLWNIEPETDIIASGTEPVGSIEGITSFGTHGYGGPCPPSGTHRYFFKLYALDTLPSLDSESSVEELERVMEGHVLAQADLIGLYTRNS